jgi:Domain of unknown function (DUF4365)
MLPRSQGWRNSAANAERAHIIADLSVHHVEGHVLRCGWVVERLVHDYGIDLRLLTFNRQGEVEAGEVVLQLKATDHLRPRSATRPIAFRLERSDLIVWLTELRPVILIVYDARKDVAYWLYVQSYFQRLKDFSLFTAGQTVTVQVPRTNVLTTAAVRKFARFRNQVIAQTRGVIYDEHAGRPLR